MTYHVLYYHQKKNNHKIELQKTLNIFHKHWERWDPKYNKKIRKFKLRKINKSYGERL